MPPDCPLCTDDASTGISCSIQACGPSGEFDYSQVPGLSSGLTSSAFRAVRKTKQRGASIVLPLGVEFLVAARKKGPSNDFSPRREKLNSTTQASHRRLVTIAAALGGMTLWLFADLNFRCVF